MIAVFILGNKKSPKLPDYMIMNCPMETPNTSGFPKHRNNTLIWKDYYIFKPDRRLAS